MNRRRNNRKYVCRPPVPSSQINFVVAVAVGGADWLKPTNEQHHNQKQKHTEGKEEKRKSGR